MQKPHRMIAVVAILALFQLVPVTAAAIITVDFEALSVGDSGPVLDAYLAGFGISFSGVTSGTTMTAQNDTLTYGGGVVDAPSGTMYLAQAAPTSGPNSFTLNFSQLLDSFGFSDSAILVPSINAPWTATARDSGGAILDSVSYTPASTHPTVTFTLIGSGIASVTFVQSPASNAAFFSANLDDFVLVPIPAPGVLPLLGLAGLMGTRRRRR